MSAYDFLGQPFSEGELPILFRRNPIVWNLP